MKRMVRMAVRKKHVRKPAKVQRNRGLNLADKSPRLHRLAGRMRTPILKESSKDQRPSPIAIGGNGNGSDKIRLPALPTETERNRTAYDSDTAIKLYLREIGQVKLLTPIEEVELAAKIKRGDKRAREQMIKANLRLVV